MIIFGVCIIVFGIALVSGLLIYQSVQPAARDHSKSYAPMVMAVGFVGLGLIMNGRISRLGFMTGSIETTLSQATVDAGTISAIKKQVEGHSAVINLVAGQARNALDLASEADIQLRSSQARLANLDSLIRRARTNLSDLAQQTHNYELVVEADNDDRTAFDRLGSIAADNSNPFHNEAQAAYTNITFAHNQPEFYQYSENWTVDINKLSPQEILSVEPILDANAKAALLQAVARRNDLGKLEKSTIFVKFIQRDKSLLAVEVATQCLNKITGQKFIPLMVDQVVQWWSSEAGPKKPRTEVKVSPMLGHPIVPESALHLLAGSSSP